MKKKLWMTFGPALVAGLVFLFILFGPSSIFGGVTNRTVEKSAVSMNESVIQGETIQSKAFTDKQTHYLPIFGSSELSRLDRFHPNVFAKKYKTGYTPFLIGRPGTQSLSHYLDINSLGKDLKGKKVIFILSPQWFQPKGVDDGHFGANFSPLQAYTFALSKEKNTPDRRYAARRLLNYQVVQNDPTLSKLLKNIATPGPNKPNDVTLTRIMGEIQYKILTRKDELESKFMKSNKEKLVDKGVSQLPNKVNFKELDRLATKVGEKNTGDNPFKVKQKYYEKKIEPIENKLKDSREDLSYAESPEYDDLQLVMDAFKKVGADVLFVNPPVNGEWLRFIGMKQEGLDEYYNKTKEMAERNGFQYYSLEKYQNDPYFLEDPIHLSWRGWVHINQAIQKFMKEPMPTGYPLTPQDYFYNKAPLKKPDKKDSDKKEKEDLR